MRVKLIHGRRLLEVLEAQVYQVVDRHLSCESCDFEYYRFDPDWTACPCCGANLLIIQESRKDWELFMRDAIKEALAEDKKP